MHKGTAIRAVAAIGIAAAVTLPLTACGSDGSNGGPVSGAEAAAMLQRAMDGEGAVACDFHDEAQPGTLTVASADRYVINTVVDGASLTMLREGGVVYMWEDGKNTGMKVQVDSPAGSRMPSLQDAIDGQDAAEAEEMTCTGIGGVEDELAVPADVTFQDAS